MENEQARILVESLIQRVQRDRESGKWRIEGTLSELEIEAMGAALQGLGGASTGRPEPVKSRHQPVSPKLAADLDLQSLAGGAARDPEVILCVDFGTAMSKAAATVDSDDNLIDLALGNRAGDKGSVYGLRSSIFVSRNERIFFGHEAIAKSVDENEPGRRRIDSLKQRLSQGQKGGLDDTLLDDATNPTSVPLSEGDIISLYLAYLTDIATTELSERTGKSRYVKRRFARPCWKEDQLAWAEGQLRIMLARAQILADTLHGKWAGGLPAGVAKATLDKVRALEKLPEWLIDQGVPEPVAAASSRVASDDRDRGLYVVVDVGAGTTDYAVFWADQEPEKGVYKIWQLQGTVDAVPQAGDTLDGYLHNYILDRAHLKPSNTDYRFADSQLSLEIRAVKERLFQEGIAKVTLSNGTQVEINRDDFQKEESVKDFARVLRDRFQGVLSAVQESWANELASFRRVGRDFLTVVLTGGGSSLPMVQELSRVIVELQGHSIPCRLADSVPAWIVEKIPALRPEYPQLAVAVGGAARELPELAPEVGAFKGLGGNTNWNINPGYKS